MILPAKKPQITSSHSSLPFSKINPPKKSQTKCKTPATETLGLKLHDTWKKILRVTWLSLITKKKKSITSVNTSISSTISQVYDIALNTTLIASLIQFLYYFNKSCRLYLPHQRNLQSAENNIY